MNTLSSARPAPRKLALGLFLVLPLIWAACVIPAQAATVAERAKAPQSKAPPKTAAKASSKTAAKGRPTVAPAKRKAVAKAKAKAATSDLVLKSNAALVIDEDSGEAVALKNPDIVLPIASLTKLMTGLVVIDAKLPMDEVLEISSADVDTEKHTYSRLAVGSELTRDEMLLLALMSSENRAAMALSRNYPGGREAFIAAMNLKAKSLGMNSTHFADPAGLSNRSVSTARDLHRLLIAARAQPLMRSHTTQLESTVHTNGRTLTFGNTNRLVRAEGDWNIDLQKTGFTNEAGRCLVMHVTVEGRHLAMIFLDSNGTLTRYADAARVRRRLALEAKSPNQPGPIATAAAASSS